MPAYRDASGFAGEAEAGFTPRDPQDLRQILRDASAQAKPVTLAGSWTGLAGGSVPRGGWLIDMAPFRRLDVAPGVAQAGAAVTLADLQAAAKASKQLYGPDPTEQTASVGGMIATNASGSRSFFYKATREHIRAITAAFVDGSLRTFRRGDAIDFPVDELPRARTTKFSTGFFLQPGVDWIDLIAGSEGTLAVVVEAELNLLPLSPHELLTGVLFFSSEESAWNAVDAWRATPGLRMLEYLDHGSLELMETQPGGAQAALMIEQELASPSLEALWDERLETEGLLADVSWVAASDADRERFRKFRHALPERINDTVRKNGFLKLGSDCAVPLDGNQAMMRYYRARLDAEFPGQYAVFGHIGDAHVHVNLLPRSEEQFTRGQALMAEFAREAVRRGGCVSAEHGLGKRKAHLLAAQYAPAHIDAMRAVKRHLDPQGLLGQGTLFPPL